MSLPPARIVDLSKALTGGMRRRELDLPSPAKLRYARWFLQAGWSLHNTAYLFDIDAAALAGLRSAAA